MVAGDLLAFRVLDFPDLTVDQSFTTGTAHLGHGDPQRRQPMIATVVGFVAGGLAGLITALLHTKAKINGAARGHSDHGRCASKPAAHGREGEPPRCDARGPSSPRRARPGCRARSRVLLLLVGVLVVKAVLDWFLYTDAGWRCRPR
ncbi:hypothetical protein QJS66_00025 [Kocuria rhizophila]|nr:hypothetical protein QJS66_00025 [Kocuria rhizophila]